MELGFDIGSSEDLIARARVIRDVVFVQEQSVPIAEEWDDKDQSCVHFLVYDRAQADQPDLGTGRLMLMGDTAKLQRIAVMAERRGAGIGAALIDEMLVYAKTQPEVTKALLGAQCHAIPFYEKLGFTAFGPVYDDAGIPHKDMTRAL